MRDMRRRNDDPDWEGRSVSLLQLAGTIEQSTQAIWDAQEPKAGFGLGRASGRGLLGVTLTKALHGGRADIQDRLRGANLAGCR